MDGSCAQVRTIEITEESEFDRQRLHWSCYVLWRELRRLISSNELLRGIAVEVDD